MEGALDGASLGFTVGSEVGVGDEMQDGTAVGSSLGV